MTAATADVILPDANEATRCFRRILTGITAYENLAYRLTEQSEPRITQTWCGFVDRLFFGWYAALSIESDAIGATAGAVLGSRWDRRPKGPLQERF